MLLGKQLSAFLFLPWLFLAMSVHLEPPGDLRSFAILIGLHLFFLAIFGLIASRAKRSAKGKFMGYSAGVWIVGSAASYVLGLVIPIIA